MFIESVNTEKLPTSEPNQYPKSILTVFTMQTETE